LFFQPFDPAEITQDQLEAIVDFRMNNVISLLAANPRRKKAAHRSAFKALFERLPRSLIQLFISTRLTAFKEEWEAMPGVSSDDDGTGEYVEESTDEDDEDQVNEEKDDDGQHGAGNQDIGKQGNGGGGETGNSQDGDGNSNGKDDKNEGDKNEKIKDNKGQDDCEQHIDAPFAEPMDFDKTTPPPRMQQTISRPMLPFDVEAPTQVNEALLTQSHERSVTPDRSSNDDDNRTPSLPGLKYNRHNDVSSYHNDGQRGRSEDDEDARNIILPKIIASSEDDDGDEDESEVAASTLASLDLDAPSKDSKPKSFIQKGSTLFSPTHRGAKRSPPVNVGDPPETKKHTLRSTTTQPTSGSSSQACVGTPQALHARARTSTPQAFDSKSRTTTAQLKRGTTAGMPARLVASTSRKSVGSGGAYTDDSQGST
jgi:hypothetical protein